MSFSSDPALLSNQLSTNVEFDVEKAEFNDILNLAYRRIVDSVNTKEGAFYLLKELATFKQLYTATDPLKNRNVYRLTINLTNVVPGLFPAFNHGISSVTDPMLIYASCKSDEATPILFTVVYPDIYMDATKVYFTNPLGVNLTTVTIVLEYTKN
jgi:hypothetical protein